MNLKALTKNQEKLIVSLARAKKRIEHGLCVCEGMRACTELYSIDPGLIQYAVISESLNLEILQAFKNIDVHITPDNKFKRLVSTVTPQGILFIAKIPSYDGSNAESPFKLVFDKISDPGNFGTIIRTALSVGLDELWYSLGTVDPFSEKVIRSALGAQFKLKLRKFDNLPSIINQLTGQGYRNVFRTEPAGGKSCFETDNLFDKSIIIFGNEASGVEELKDTVPLHIPMPGKFESINVAQAATVILFEAVRRKIL